LDEDKRCCVRSSIPFRNHLIHFFGSHLRDPRRDDDPIGACIAAAAIVDWHGTVAPFFEFLRADGANLQPLLGLLAHGISA
jgi:hypothetical protein